MLLILCPHCGPRAEDDFVYGGDATRRRPDDPARLPDVEWLAYLYDRPNEKGPHAEWWYHQHGCRSWLRVERDTLTHAISAVQAACA